MRTDRRPFRAAPPRGIALVLVLWVVALLVILLGGFVVLARTENLQTRHLFDGTRARYAAESGLAYAALELRRVNPELRWVPDGRSYAFEFEGAKVEVAITDESGKVDINGADEQVLAALLRVVGADEQRAAQIADAALDFRDPDDLIRPNGAEDREYEAAGLPYTPSNRNFGTVEELQQVLGMDYELYRLLEPHITVYARASRPNPAFASATVLQALPGMTPEIAAALVDQRRQLLPGQAAEPLLLPDGTPLVPAGGGVTYTVRSKATLPNGAWTVLDATIRLGGAPGGRAFSILRWRPGSVR